MTTEEKIKLLSEHVEAALEKMDKLAGTLTPEEAEELVARVEERCARLTCLLENLRNRSVH